MALPEGSYTQTAFVVRDIEASAERWTAMTGAGPWFLLEPLTENTNYRGTPCDAPYRLAVTFLGSAMLELVAPLNDAPSIFAEVLNQRGEGFHHVSPHITALHGASFDARCADLEWRGLKVAMTNMVVGMGRAAFYDATDSIGGFIEVFEIGPGYAMVPTMADIHAGWNGTDPLRRAQTLFG